MNPEISASAERALPGRMRAARRDSYGPPSVVTIDEVDVPTPADDEVLIRVLSSSVNPADKYFCLGEPKIMRPSSGWFRPKEPLLGLDAAGVVERVGAGVTDIAVGDEVVGEIGASWAEFATAKRRHLALKPPSVDFEQAGAIGVAGLTALQGLRDKAEVRAGDRVLVTAASGGVGHLAVQLAKHWGAEVVATCSTRNVEWVRALGADEVISYTSTDVAAVRPGFDVIFDNAGVFSLKEGRALLNPNGRWVLVGAPHAGGLLGPARSLIGKMIGAKLRRVPLLSFVAQSNAEDLATLAELMAEGALAVTIDRRFGLDEASQALQHQLDGHAQGKSVIAIQEA